MVSSQKIPCYKENAYAGYINTSIWWKHKSQRIFSVYTESKFSASPESFRKRKQWWRRPDWRIWTDLKYGTWNSFPGKRNLCSGKWNIDFFRYSFPVWPAARVFRIAVKRKYPMHTNVYWPCKSTEKDGVSICHPQASCIKLRSLPWSARTDGLCHVRLWRDWHQQSTYLFQ